MHDRRPTTPRTDTVLNDPRLQQAIRNLGQERVKEAVRAAQQRYRDGEIESADVPGAAVAALPATSVTLRRIVNATGVLVHTNLGRAPLSRSAVDAVRVAGGATDVEFDLSTGRRDRRGRAALNALARAVPDAEDVHVVNNGAAALALVASALANGRDIVIARGELVEIGDGFRIPELIESTGARLREVGTTNRVTLDDYAEAVGDDTALVLKVHPSNFVIDGFSSAVPVDQLRDLGPPVVADIGSGLLAPHPRLPDEPDAAGTLRAGAALVTASGDKLLGGPQAGLLLGRADLVERLRRFPLARAVRADKLTFAALEATLTGPTPPVADGLATTPEVLLERAAGIADELRDLVDADAVASEATVGGGGAPGVVLASAAVSLPEWLADLLRAADPPIVGRLQGGRLRLDLIGVAPDDDAAVVAAVRSVLAAGEG